jgi:gliding motility-associated-like protein
VDVVPAQLADLDANETFGSGTNLGNGNFVVYDGASDNVTLQNLQPGTTYHFAVFEFNGSLGKVYLTASAASASFTTAPRPSVAARSLNVTLVEGDRLTVTFTRGNGTRRLIVVRKDELVNATPVDLSTYTPGAFGAGSQIGTGNFVTHITSGSTNTVTITGLQPNTSYGVAIFEIDGLNGNERYMTSAYINQLAKTASAPTSAPSALLYNSLGSTSVNLSWTNGNGSGRMIVLLPSRPVTFAPITLSTHGSSSANFTSTVNNLPASHKQMYRGSGTTVTLTNLSPGLTYHVAFYEYNGNGQPVYNPNPLRGYFTTLPSSGVAIGGFDAITFCPSQQVDVPYISANLLNAGNQMSVELSDINGSFASPLVLGTQSTTNTSGFITSILPSSLAEGTGYRLRVRASNPNLVSADNGADLQIVTSVQPTFAIVGGQSTSCGTAIELNTSQTGYNLQWFRNGVAIPGATTNTHFATLTGDYQVRIAGASGGCQLLSTPSTLTISERPTFNLNLNAAYCEDQVVNITSGASPTGGIFTGAGVSSGTFNANVAGIGQHILTYEYVDAVSSCAYQEGAVVQVKSKPAPPATISASGCASSSIVLQATGATPSQTYAWYTDPTGGSAIAGATTGSYATPTLTSSQTYYATINDGGCESDRTSVTAQVNAVPASPVATATSSCVPASLTLTASGAADGQYQWYSDETGTTAITGEVNAVFNTPIISTSTTYYVSINNGTCESERTEVTATIATLPSPPTTTSASSCGPASITLTAAGGTDGEYRWYADASTAAPLTGEVNSNFNTPLITISTTYYVAISNGTCESTRQSVTATINAVPAKPAITASISADPSNTITLCNNSVVLSAPAGFTYLWSNGLTTEQIEVSQSGTYSVVVVSSENCTSATSDVINVEALTNCGNSAPAIAETTLFTSVEGSIAIDLIALISDIDNNIDLASLRIVTQPISGATATINASYLLTVDYRGVSFSGQDRLTVEVCDQLGVCTQQEILIDVAGDIVIYNAVSPNGDGKNDHFIIQYIDAFEDTRTNRVSIFNRWGDVVFETENYNNTDNFFDGENKNGNKLPSGTYFYKIEFNGGRKTRTGYLSIKR